MMELWDGRGISHTICTISFQTDNHANTSSLDFYRPDALVPTNSVRALKAFSTQEKYDSERRE